MTNPYQIITGSVKGRGKHTNEDGVLVLSNNDYHLLAIFDGVGSAKGAKKSVTFAKKFLTKEYKNSYIQQYFDLGGLLRKLNKAILNSGIKEAYSTCVMLYLPFNNSLEVKYVYLGDSRVYAVGKQYFSRLSTDHKLQGTSNVITKYLGKENLQKSDYKEHICTTHEYSFFICTDGAYNLIENLGKDLSKFHNVLLFKYMKRVQNGINKYISKDNSDDASYIFARFRHV